MSSESTCVGENGHTAEGAEIRMSQLYPVYWVQDKAKVQIERFLKMWGTKSNRIVVKSQSCGIK
jgi:hypothetical protein